MKTKLTLSVDKELVLIARQQASSSRTSVSVMFSDFIRSSQVQAEKSAVPSVTSMTGSLKRYHIDDTKQAIRASYAKKYLN